ncbi:hypothetical protein ACFQ4N_04100 [Oceanobacillus iheyensis]|uniref:hypothetical protein n=1 Tax=Oceanobacillus iheyensis TaxID=182710 RepID=UPI0036301196
MDPDFDDETTSKLKNVTESYIENNFEAVESIELDEPYISPMWGTKIDGTVNGQGGFSISLNDDLTVAAISTKEGFPDTKEECKDQICDY